MTTFLSLPHLIAVAFFGKPNSTASGLQNTKRSIGRLILQIAYAAHEETRIAMRSSLVADLRRVHSDCEDSALYLASLGSLMNSGVLCRCLFYIVN